MKSKKMIVFALCAFTLIASCKDDKEIKENKIDVLNVAQLQYEALYNTAQDKINLKKYTPRTTKEGKVVYTTSYSWTSGFYPGTLWYLYQLTKEEKWKDRALDYTQRMDSVKNYTGNHDIGFMMECSFGNAMKVNPSKKYDSVIVQSAKSLITRYRPKAGIIQSWNKGKKWNCPVIIDNMMNLELLFHATKISGDSIYYNIAVSHADNTIKNHFREDMSSYHVVNYDIETGETTAKNTHQGHADSSAWSRGQAWGLYGYTVAYRETKNKRYLTQAIKIANFIKNNTKLPKDQVPYWDYDVEINEQTPRDASAAAITASALIELSTYTKGESEHLNWAKTIVNSLSSKNYLAEVGTNGGFLLKHSVGSLPHNVEVDVPLNYADYYYLEALYRLKNLK